MQRIAGAAGVGRATVYRHFKSRDALLTELARAGLAQAGNRLREAEIEEQPIAEALAYAVRVLCEVGDRYVAVFRDGIPLDPELAMREVRGPIDNVIERGQRDGLLRDDLPAVAQRELLLAVVARWLRSPRFPDPEERSRVIVELILDGLRRR